MFLTSFLKLVNHSELWHVVLRQMLCTSVTRSKGAASGAEAPEWWSTVQCARASRLAAGLPAGAFFAAELPLSCGCSLQRGHAPCRPSMGGHPSHEQGGPRYSPAVDRALWAGAARAWAGAGARSARAGLPCAPTLARAELPASCASGARRSHQHDWDAADRTPAAASARQRATSCEPIHPSQPILSQYRCIMSADWRDIASLLSICCWIRPDVDTQWHGRRQAGVSACS